MRAWGASPADLAKAQALADEAAPQDDKPYLLWPENAVPWAAFCALRTQWSYVTTGATGGAMGGSVLTVTRVGLRYEAVCAWLETNVPRRKRRSLMTDLQAMEVAVLQADAELRAEKEE